MKKYVFFLLPLILFGGCKNITRPFNSNLAADNKDVNAARSAHPNIILIVGDDIGYEVLSCNGGQSYQTPFLDDIAAKGVRYTECHACPLCSPSRVSLLTGKYNFRNYTAWGYLDPASNKTIGNMLQDQGYATCYAGKWQLSGYDSSIHALGWQKYSVWDPGDPLIAGSRYKNPHIYQDGNFLPDTAIVNKYGEDMFVDYISSFMDTATKPYFIYYAMTLAHAPFSPTPDDAEFAAWDPNDPGDPKFFPSMIKYMDKKMGELLSIVRPNTYVIYVGDNGTPQEIHSLFNGVSVKGGKTKCTEYGTHVPLILYRSGTMLSSIDTSLIDLTDFLPTLAKLANIPKPGDYGKLDGTSFYPKKSKRESIYYHYNPLTDKQNELTIWVQNSVYKKYDTTVRTVDSAKRGKFFNIRLDPNEQAPIKRQFETPEEKYIDSSFRATMRFYANQQ